MPRPAFDKPALQSLPVKTLGCECRADAISATIAPSRCRAKFNQTRTTRGGIEHIQTSPLAFLPPSGICPRGMTAAMRRNDEPSPAEIGEFEFMLTKSEGRS
jgi:hypothetical protein